jgi:biotin carboxyl carrier protein
MKLHAIVADTEVDVAIERDGNRVIALVGGREYELEAQQIGSRRLLRHADGRVFDCRVEGRLSSGQAVEVFVGTSPYSVTLINPKHLRGAASAGGNVDEAARIVAPMPGKVVRVLVEPGTMVLAGAGIIVVEAMKMQNEMKAPKAGIVTALNTEVGATVNAGDVLAVVE